MASRRRRSRRAVANSILPRGSKYPIFEVSGPKSIPLMVLRTRVLKCWVLGPSGLIMILASACL